MRWAFRVTAAVSVALSLAAVAAMATDGFRLLAVCRVEVGREPDGRWVGETTRGVALDGASVVFGEAGSWRQPAPAFPGDPPAPPPPAVTLTRRWLVRPAARVWPGGGPIPGRSGRWFSAENSFVVQHNTLYDYDLVRVSLWALALAGVVLPAGWGLGRWRQRARRRAVGFPVVVGSPTAGGGHHNGSG